MRLERLGTGPERRFCLRLRTRSWVSEVRGSKEPVRSRFSRTSRETRLLRQVTPTQVHRSVVEFHEDSLLALSEADLKSINGFKSGFGVAWTRKKKRKESKICGIKHVRLAIVCSARSRERERERVGREVKGFLQAWCGLVLSQ